MEDSNPYRTPMETIPADAYVAPAKKSASIQVFGILHLVFGVLGILIALAGVTSTLMGNPGMAAGGMIDPGTVAALEEVKHWSLLDAGLKGVLAILLILSGIMLLKSKFQGLRLSNAYCFLSIIHKAFAIWLFLAVMWPIMQGMYAHMPGMDETSIKIAQKAGMFGGIVTIALSLIYPILALILLNREHPKASLN